MPVKAGYLVAAGGGAILIWSGLRGKSWSTVLRDVISGQKPAIALTAYPITGAPPGGGGGGGGPGPTGPIPKQDLSGSASANRALGRIMATAYGWGFGQNWQALDNGWGHLESGWRTNAAFNPSDPYNSAYGIPQANPGTKMASAGANWKTSARTQIKWGLGYVKATYKSPANVPGWLGGPYSGY